MLVDRLDDLAEHLEANGHPVSWNDDFPYFRRFYCEDPFGNRLEFLKSRDRYHGPDNDWDAISR